MDFLPPSSASTINALKLAGKPGQDVPKGTLNSILRQAGLK
jgi:predicted RNA binding protein YcfA (HicA-like mRNA interferase family)